MTIRRVRPPGETVVSLRDQLIRAGLEERLAEILVEMPHKTVSVEPRRPFREPGCALSAGGKPSEDGVRVERNLTDSTCS